MIKNNIIVKIWQNNIILIKKIQEKILDMKSSEDSRFWWRVRRDRHKGGILPLCIRLRQCANTSTHFSPFISFVLYAFSLSALSCAIRWNNPLCAAHFTFRLPRPRRRFRFYLCSSEPFSFLIHFEINIYIYMCIYRGEKYSV